MANIPKDRQNWIYGLLVSDPNLSYSDCWAKYMLEWGNSKSTFDSDWKKANAEFEKYKADVQEKIIEKTAQIEVDERIERGIISKVDALKILSDFAKSDEETTKDRISAIKEMSDMEGWKAPSKIDLTADIKPLEFVIITKDANGDT